MDRAVLRCHEVGMSSIAAAWTRGPASQRRTWVRDNPEIDPKGDSAQKSGGGEGRSAHSNLRRYVRVALVLVSAGIPMSVILLMILTIERGMFSSGAWKSRELWERGRRVHSTRDRIQVGLKKHEVIAMLGPAERSRDNWLDWEYLDGTHGKWLSVRFEHAEVAEVKSNDGDSYPSSGDGPYYARVRTSP